MGEVESDPTLMEEAMPRPKKTSEDKRIGTLWEPVDATPEEIAQACMQGPPKRKWDFKSKKKEPEAAEDA